MQRMNFSSLIETFAVDFQLVLPSVEGAGKYIHGEWFPTNEEPKTVSGAIIPYDNRTIYQSGGTLTSSDRQLAYVGSIPLGSKIIDMGKEYKSRKRRAICGTLCRCEPLQIKGGDQ